MAVDYKMPCFGDSTPPHDQESLLHHFGKTGRLRHVPTQNRLAVHLVHVLTAGARGTRESEFDFTFGNFNFSVYPNHGLTVCQFGNQIALVPEDQMLRRNMSSKKPIRTRQRGTADSR